MIDNYTTEEKLDFIFLLEENNNLCTDDWNKIKILSEDNDSEVRYRVAELLALFPSEKSEEWLISMLNDDNHMVRAAACDSLSFSTSSNTSKLLWRLAKDSRYLVRGYAILSIGDIQKNIDSNSNEVIQLLKRLDSKESCEWVKIAISRSLYILGEYSYGTFLLEKLNSRNYKSRSFVLNLLEPLIDSNITNNIPNMLQILKQRLTLESAFAVKLKLQSLISKISNTDVKVSY